ncbi:hypothetical protein MHBO_001705 [Bonamia ostreae]|uniref:Uncharacterized protein n=1 Tax=Bonamia ostreae TaxID=126728 RepID=A0ABV2AKJ1_9EUKA
MLKNSILFKPFNRTKTLTKNLHKLKLSKIYPAQNPKLHPMVEIFTEFEKFCKKKQSEKLLSTAEDFVRNRTKEIPKHRETRLLIKNAHAFLNTFRLWSDYKVFSHHKRNRQSSTNGRNWAWTTTSSKESSPTRTASSFKIH